VIDVDKDLFLSAKPFPHVVLNGLWDNDRLDAIAAEFPARHHPSWQTYPDPKEYGKMAGAEAAWGRETLMWFNEMHDGSTARWLESFTGIDKLMANDLGGGMHMTCEGGRLAMHADFNLHPANSYWERRLNVLVFLNHDWQEEWGGTLYLGENKEVKVVPEFNRTVIFATSDSSWHGHPEPIIGDHSRKSLAIYYYAPRRAIVHNSHSTVWADE